MWGGTSTLRWLPGLVLIDKLYFQPFLTNIARGNRETVFLLYSMFRYLRRGQFSHCVREIKTCKVTTGITRFCCPAKVTDKATIFCIHSCRGCAFVNFCRSAGYTRKVLGTRRTSLPAKQHGRQSERLRRSGKVSIPPELGFIIGRVYWKIKIRPTSCTWLGLTL